MRELPIVDELMRVLPHPVSKQAADTIAALYEALEVIAGGCVDISDTAIIVGDGAKTVMAQVRAALSLALGESPNA